MSKLSDTIPKLLSEVGARLDSAKIQRAGPPFIRYLTVDMPKAMDVEVGWPVAKASHETGRIHGGFLPAGRYVSLVYTGPYDGLVRANADLQAWATDRHIALEGRNTPKGRAFAGRAELYLTDPAGEPDPHKWKTEILFLTAQPNAGPNHGR